MERLQFSAGPFCFLYSNRHPAKVRRSTFPLDRDIVRLSFGTGSTDRCIRRSDPVMPPRTSATSPGNGAGRFRPLAFPEETTTRNGMLATIVAVAPTEDAQFFHGFLWPLGERRISARWALSGAHIGEERGLDIDPASSDVRAIIARFSQA
jgi:hypothetical protein